MNFFINGQWVADDPLHGILVYQASFNISRKEVVNGVLEEI